MQTRRAHPVSPLAIVLPHSTLPRRASLLSINSATSPHTPRSCGSPCSSIFIPSAANRKSTDSWNSSNGPDEFEWEWKPEQLLLLSRTLDALPAHLVTPFNGPIPPSNLLDKIARGVSQAKGPIEWPHSLRATRVKLIELSRLRAKEEALAEQQQTMSEETEIESEHGSNSPYVQDGKETSVKGTVGSRRPLYRQSSMDFINNAHTDIKNNEHLARLSNRLQRAERQVPRLSYQRTPRKDCSLNNDVSSLRNPSTPSSSTLNTLSSFSTQSRAVRRTVSSLSSMSILSSSSDGMSLPNPRVQRIMEDHAVAPISPPKDPLTNTKAGVKRMPSFSAAAQETRREQLAHPRTEAHTRKNSGTYPSSDEEEKVRSKQAKKPRKSQMVFGVTATPPPASPAPSSPSYSPTMAKRTSTTKSKTKLSTDLESSSKCPMTLKTPKDIGSTDTKSREKERKKENLHSVSRDSKAKQPSRPLPMNLQRNPSILGEELPQLKNAPFSPASAICPSRPSGLRSPSPSPISPKGLSPHFDLTQSPHIPNSRLQRSDVLSPAADIQMSPSSVQKVKTLRRVRRLAPGRRISFGSLATPLEELNTSAAGENVERGNASLLGSAFQLH